jgi:hypothetical protein
MGKKNRSTARISPEVASDAHAAHKVSKIKDQLVSTKIPFKSVNQEQPYLVVRDLEFHKLGAFTADETIAYELFTNKASNQIIDLMLLAQEIAHDLEWTYQKSIKAINSCGQSITPELIGYAHRLKEVGIFGYSDTQRKKGLVKLFINLRIDCEYTLEKAGKLPTPELNKIYDFMISELNEWPAPKPPISDADMGKQSIVSEPASTQTLMNTGENAMNPSKQPEPPTPNFTDLAACRR